jgi:hypothetical protein
MSPKPSTAFSLLPRNIPDGRRQCPISSQRRKSNERLVAAFRKYSPAKIEKDPQTDIQLSYHTTNLQTREK